MGAPRFQIAHCSAADVSRLRRELSVSDALAQVLVRRGLADARRARAFLVAAEAHPPSAFDGIERAVAAILRRVCRGERITIHGDYDVDGVCATAVLVRALRALGANVDWHLPDRADGYGLRADTVRRLAARGTSLLVTVDCAIGAVSEVDLARELGIDVVVTDHHAPRSDGLLPAATIVHPAVCGYPCPQLCATAVAHKLAQALVEQVGAGGVSIGGACAEPAREQLERDLDLVALATIADVVALVGENRALVRRGLPALARTTKPGLRALMAVAAVDPARVDERAVGFALGPRLNAAGRMRGADAALELLLTDDPRRGQQLAGELDRVNHERRRVEAHIRGEAEAQLTALGERAAYVLAGERWHPGVIGIVAARLAESHRRPVVLISLTPGELGRGSGRSGVEAFDLLGALDACAVHLTGYGGHRAAAGVHIQPRCVEAFARALAEHARGVLRADDVAPVERVDAIVGGDALGMGLAEELRMLAPFGRGNPDVSLLVADATFADVRPMGEGRHVRFTVHSRGTRARGVAFGTGGRLPVGEHEPIEATFKLEVNEFRGVSEPRLVLRQARAARGVTPPAPRLAQPRPSADERQGELALFALP
jgi:single-stranded-DNA-specific exonuclease